MEIISGCGLNWSLGREREQERNVPNSASPEDSENATDIQTDERYFCPIAASWRGPVQPNPKPNPTQPSFSPKREKLCSTYPIWHWAGFFLGAWLITII